MSDLSVTSRQKTIEEIIEEGATSVSSRNKTELGKHDFLNLLITQLRYQDPLNPTSDKEFIAQMAQFSALEQMMNLNTSFNAIRAYNLIGKNVYATIKDSKTGDITEVSGDVTGVKYISGEYYVVVKGVDVPINSIAEVTEGIYSSYVNLSSFTGLLGCEVSGIVYDYETWDMIKVTGTVKALQKGLYEDYAVLDGVAVEIAGLYERITTTDPDYVKNKLKEAYENGKAIDLIIKDGSTGKTVPVTAKIAKYDIAEDGKITAILDDLHIPVDGITKITGLTGNSVNGGSALESVRGAAGTGVADGDENGN